MSVCVLVWARVRACSCLTLCDPKDCSPPDSSIHGDLQVRILEWVAISFSKESPQPRDQTHCQVDSLPLSYLQLFLPKEILPWKEEGQILPFLPRDIRN